MSDDLIAQQKARQQAGQDQADIASLEKFEPFQRYWMRRLRQKHSEFTQAFLHSDMTHEQRETVRQKILLLEDLTAMPKADHQSASREVETPPQPVDQRPVQHG